ncbi:MAG TPA: thioredoxin fold domain-containing protein [Gammaproteobacteria bacterium]|nr:thioredoxin fold domain-containing protein [Gammaproteobacteria bacterium]HJN00378.1 thioredoxin fold domain-containing protein [Gammaproteobacteria bacterium]
MFFSVEVSSNEGKDSLQEIDLILQTLLEIFPGANGYTLDDSAVDGLYAVNIGSEVIYISKDGKFLIRGEILDLQNSVNLTEEKRVLARLDAIQSMDEKTMIIYEPKKTNHTVTIFTDIDCGYCRKFHQQIDDYLDLGIRVRYLSFPRTGPETESWEKAHSVWCSKDRQGSLDRAKQGKKVDGDNCPDSPVQSHYNLGSVFNISGTPTILTDKGKLIVGYLPPESLLFRLNEEG